MIHFPAVHELVNDEVIDDVRGSLDQSPIERDGSPRRAGAPAGFLRPDSDAADGDGVLEGEVAGTWW